MIWWLLAGGWLVLALVGMGFFLAYKLDPGATRQAPPEWPEVSRLARTPERATLVLIAHPRCSCTEATLGELARVMARTEGRVQTHVLFLKPAVAAEGWEATSLWRQATAIPGLQVHADPEGHQAALFGAATSGDTLLYDAAGRLVFRGGITGARGHAGSNPGRRSVLALLSGAVPETRAPAVFGCPLQDHTAGTNP